MSKKKHLPKRIECTDTKGAVVCVDDNGSTEAVAMDKAGLIDLDNEDHGKS